METLSPFAFVTLVTLISGAGGTGLGGLIGALFKSESNRTISLLLAFAGGVMTAMVCFDLLAEAEEAASQVTEHGVLLVILAVALGVAVVYLLNHLIDRKTRKEVSHTADADHPISTCLQPKPPSTELQLFHLPCDSLDDEVIHPHSLSR